MPTELNQWEQIYRNEGHVLPTPAPLVIRFADQLRERGARSILDLGCGSGRHTVYMRKKGFDVTGMDNAPTGLKLTTEWLQQEGLKADLILGNMRRPFPFRNDTFDALLSTQVIHHSLHADVIATAREIQRVVCRGGIILVSVPARKEIALGEDDSLEIEPDTFVPTRGNEKGLPHHFFTLDEFRAIFPGFEVLDSQVFEDRIIALTASKI
jgi:SAM-dependent methyltransferase